MSLRVDRITLRELRIPLRTPFRASHGTTEARRVALVELRVDGTRAAWSECVAGERPDYTAETFETAWHVLETWVAPSVIGRTFDAPEGIAEALAWIRGHPMARAAVEMACWATLAERRGESLAGLLGGTRTALPCARTLGITDDHDILASRARAAVDEGYARIKLKIEPGRDLEPLRAVRDAVGPEVALSADANGAYRLEDAEDLARLDGVGLVMIEQPLPARDFAALAELQTRIATPICLDESIASVEDARTMLALDAGRIVNIKPGRVGGFGPALAIHDLCLEAGIDAWCGGMFETGLGRAYNAALASLPGFTMAGDLTPAGAYLASDIVAQPAGAFDGSVRVPRGPGVGVVVDHERIDALTVRRSDLG
ncbi:MAG TPA: o-succinylbenzoate synthase [Longimicrobiales bacterium]|nr:o-succinylbenzoate synthase [Longimicrobiales bacterium]